MKKMLLILLLTLNSTVLSAKTLVLIHGYREDGMVWRNQGVTRPLLQNNWSDGGTFTIRPDGIQKYSRSKPIPLKRNVFYTVELPWTRSIDQQATILRYYLTLIYAHRPDAITLVGHSNGGLVARYALVSGMNIPINALISIATPHLGSPLAQLANVAHKTPLNELSQFVGNQLLNDSARLFEQLKPEKPHNFLYWLNHQPHPDITYISIIRKNTALLPHKFDYIVPPYSQNMNKVFALRNKSATFSVNKNHSLNSLDGRLINQFIPLIN
jgi:pimeloyl-ACP methyl ester carboxylesterase